jgi:uncharacterized membrane protein YbaN (DUF454 family)
MSKFRKNLFIILGIISTALGIIGIFIPVLPTTPFLLLAAFLYSRSSDRFLHWLYTNRLCGTYIKNYRDGKGIPLKQKILTIVLLWLTIGSSVIYFINPLWLRVLLVIIAIGVTAHLVRVKTYKPALEEPRPNTLVQDELLD